MLAVAAAWPAKAATDFDYQAFLQAVHLPPQFSLTLAVGEPLVRFPMFACFDDDGRLYVALSSGRDLYAGLRKLSRDCRVVRLEDADGDGRFEKVTLFQDNVTFPMGLAWHGGRLYLADPPSLVALTDTDGDGRADKTEVILSGFGHTDNGSLHGLVFGPDGHLYFTMGEPDGWKLPRGDGTFLEGNAGALFRARADGSRVELISRGFVNLVEVEFLPGGERIATDNWYQRPAGGVRDALIDCAPGGLYPYAPDTGTPLPRTGLMLPPLTLRPAVAHSGLTRLRTAGFPAEWQESLFVAEHNTRKVTRHALRREGSSFSSTPNDFVVGEHPDFHPSDVLEDPDGSLLIVDTGGWYVEHCPTGRIRDSHSPGGIYRVRWDRASKIPDPWGRKLEWSNLSSSKLAQRVRDSRPVVAERAAEELVRRKEAGSLAAALDSREEFPTRLRALWALARLGNAETLAALRGLLIASSQPVLVCGAARALEGNEDKAAGDALAGLLESTNAPIRRSAAEALATCGSRAHAPRLANALRQAADPFEQHACIGALLTLADEPFARSLLSQDSPALRRAALHLLDQPRLASLRFADLVAPLGDREDGVREDARQVLERHPAWAGDALPWLREQVAMAAADVDHVSALANLLIAFQSAPAIRRFISELLGPGSTASEQTRAFLLELLPSLTLKPPEPSWLSGIPAALENPTLRRAALQAAVAYPNPQWRPALAKLSEDPAAPVPQRLLAARLLERQPSLSPAVFALALGSLDAKAPAPDRLAAVDLLSRSRWSNAQLRLLLETLQRGVPISPDAIWPALMRTAQLDAETKPVLGQFLLERLRAGWSPPRATLGEALALLPPDDAALRAALLSAWEQTNAGKLRRLSELKPLLARGDPERGRGLFATTTCLGCHRVGGQGGLVGPDLTTIGAIRSGPDLLESILYPSSSFAQGYEPYTLVRKSDEELSGNLVSQGPEGVRLRDGTGMIHVVRADDIVSLERQQLSMMPEGLEQLLTREQFADLLAYLQALK